MLDGTVDRPTYTAKKVELDTELIQLREQRQLLQAQATDDRLVQQRLDSFRKALETNETLQVFDKAVFEAVVDRVIVGATNEDGTIDPLKLTFIYKMGVSDVVDSKKACSYTQSDTCGDLCTATTKNYIGILNFRHFFNHSVFTNDGDKIRNKQLKKYINDSMVLIWSVGTQ